MVGSAFSPPYLFRDLRLNKLIEEDQIEVTLIPAGVLVGAWHELSGGRLGLITDIGLGTFVDPRNIGGRLTPSAQASSCRVVERIEIFGEERLLYRPEGIDICLIRGTTADEAGNVSLEEEPIRQAVMAQAMATKAAGGTVIAQVKRVVRAGQIDAQIVHLPGFLVDVLTVDEHQQMHEYGVAEDSPAWVGAQECPVPPVGPVARDAAWLVSNRAIAEIQAGDVVNLGSGIPISVLSKLIAERGISEQCLITVEQGSFGGVNLGGRLCQAHWNATSILDLVDVFNVYQGGGIDVAFLGAAQVSARGDVNVAMTGGSIAGIGGFMEIAQSAHKVVFCTTLTYGGLNAVPAEDGTVHIRREGRTVKFVPDVDLVCFSGPQALGRGQQVLYVTERCVFRLEPEGLVLIETAKGIDVDRDIRPHVGVDFRVQISA
jgi:propionate CoA-transferase